MSTIHLTNVFASHVATFPSESFSRRLIRKLYIGFCFATIGYVSVLDMYFVQANPHILLAEQNPVCLALIKLEPDSKVFFFIAKSIGSIGVLLTLWYLLKIRYRHAIAVLLTVAVFQVALLSYLCLGDSRIGGCPNFALLFQHTPDSIFRLNR